MAEEFKKFDNEKPDYSLFEPVIMETYCKVATMGSKKYGRNNWKNMKVEDYARIVAAEYRHDMASQSGEELDPESGLPHLWHKLWNCVARVYLEKKYGHSACMEILRGKNEA